MKIATPLLAAAMMVAVIPTQALAVNLLYSLSPVGGNDYRASWLLPFNPSPTQAVDGEGFAIERLSGSFPQTTEGDAYIDFFSASNGGGIVISDADGPGILATLFGDQLYTGSETTPTMRTGLFTLTSSGADGRRYLLRVMDAAGAVPEPSAWLLMIAGFGMAGTALRKRHRVTVRYA